MQERGRPQSRPHPTSRLFCTETRLRAVGKSSRPAQRILKGFLKKYAGRTWARIYDNDPIVKRAAIHPPAASGTASRGRPQLYEFGPFRLDPAERKLLRENQIVPLTPKAFDTLVVLVLNSGHLVEKEELLGLIWPGTYVEEEQPN